MVDELITQEQAAKIIGVERTTLWRWQREGKIKPWQTVGSRPLYRKADLADLAEAVRLRKTCTNKATVAA